MNTDRLPACYPIHWPVCREFEFQTWSCASTPWTGIVWWMTHLGGCTISHVGWAGTISISSRSWWKWFVLRKGLVNHSQVPAMVNPIRVLQKGLHTGLPRHGWNIAILEGSLRTCLGTHTQNQTLRVSQETQQLQISAHWRHSAEKLSTPTVSIHVHSSSCPCVLYEQEPLKWLKEMVRKQLFQRLWSSAWDWLQEWLGMCATPTVLCTSPQDREPFYT